MSYILLIIGILVIVTLAGMLWQSIQFKKEVKRLLDNSKLISNKVFGYDQLSGLPVPVQRYFKHVLREGQPYVDFVRLKHAGQFKTDQNGNWANIKGEQYFTAGKPGFVWKGKTSMFTARDMFINGKGRLVVSIFSAFTIVDEHGEKLGQGELLRWLGESVWFPTNLLPSENLRWDSIDSLSAKLTYKYLKNQVSYNVRFNQIGEIVQLETMRYKGNGHLEKWVGKCRDYKEMNGVIIPCNIEGAWDLQGGVYSYANFHLKEIEYDVPEIF